MQKPNVSFKLCHHNQYNYLQYTIKTDEKTIIFDNITYVMFNVLSTAFKEITRSIGGFFANMTTRHITELEKEQNCQIAKIMLCPIPQKTNQFLFWFIYLDNNNKIVDYMKDDNYYDYEYFKNRLQNAISETGTVYALLSNPNFEIISKTIYKYPSTTFGIKINDKEISYKDTLVYPDIDIFKPEMRKNLQKINADHIVFTFTCDAINYIHLIGTIIDKNGNIIKDYQAYSGICDINEYVKQIQQERNNPVYDKSQVNTDPYTVRINLNVLQHLTNKLSIKE